MTEPDPNEEIEHQQMVIVVQFKEQGTHEETAKVFDEIMSELRAALSQKNGVQVYGALDDRAKEILTILETPDDSPLPR